jgi:hypothetical protein
MIRQTSVAEAAKLDFANGMRSMMRQDPDVILVGEIRDADTAEMAFRAAMTGHQVYSTLHTNSAIGAIPRLLDIGILPDIMAGNIIGIVAQRLVRRLCPHCRSPTANADTNAPARLGRPRRRPRSTAPAAATAATSRATAAASPSWNCCAWTRPRRTDRPPRHHARNPHAAHGQGLPQPGRRRPAPRARRLHLARRSRPRRRPDERM